MRTTQLHPLSAYLPETGAAVTPRAIRVALYTAAVLGDAPMVDYLRDALTTHRPREATRLDAVLAGLGVAL